MKKKLTIILLLIILVLIYILPVFSENLGLTKNDLENYAKAQKDAFKYELLYEKERDKYILGFIHEQAFWLFIGLGVGINVTK